MSWKALLGWSSSWKLIADARCSTLEAAQPRQGRKARGPPSRSVKTGRCTGRTALMPSSLPSKPVQLPAGEHDPPPGATNSGQIGIFSFVSVRQGPGESGIAMAENELNALLTELSVRTPSRKEKKRKKKKKEREKENRAGRPRWTAPVLRRGLGRLILAAGTVAMRRAVRRAGCGGLNFFASASNVLPPPVRQCQQRRRRVRQSCAEERCQLSGGQRGRAKEEKKTKRQQSKAPMH